jgi:hypothetical protein
MKPNNELPIPKNVAYLLLFGIQIFGAMIFIWQDLSEFEQLLLNPGEQLPKDIYADLIIFGVFCMMQISFWCRILYVPIPFRRAIGTERLKSKWRADVMALIQGRQ